MALVVENGTGLSNANSYQSVAGADAYHATHSGSTVWSGSTTPQKEQALIIASQYLDIVYGRQYVGSKMSRLQGLLWPRVGVTDIDGFGYGSNEIPQAVLDATSEAALRYRQDGSLIVDVSSKDQAVVSQSVTVGPIQKSTTYAASGKVEQKKYPVIEQLIGEFCGGFGSVPTERA
jgi:hypothetical protein